MSSIKIINDDVKFPVLLDSSVYTQWRKHVKTYLPKFGQAGKALLTGKRDEPVYPTPTDMVLNAAGQPTLIPMYEHEDIVYDGSGTMVSPFKFVGNGLKDFKRAVANFSAVVAAYNVGNVPLSHFLIVHLGADVTRAVYSDPKFVAALSSPITDTFAMLSIIDTLYGKGTGRTVVKQLQHFLNCRQGDLSHEAYVELIKDGVITTTANYEVASIPGYISIDALSCAIYLGGLDSDKFKAKLDATYVANPTGFVTDLHALVADYSLYAREQLSVSATPSQYTSALVASGGGVSPRSLKCATCFAPMLPTNVNRFGKPNRYCPPCYRQQQATFNSSNGKPGPIVKKATAAELLAARALIAAHDTPSPIVLPTSSAATFAADSDSD